LVRVTLKYGENPHQTGFWEKSSSIIKRYPKLSFNDLQNLNIGFSIFRYTELPTLLIIKHANVAGAAQGNYPSKRLLEFAINTDPRACLNGLLIANFEVSYELLKEANSFELDGIAAPSFEEENSDTRLFITQAPYDLIKTKKKERRELIDGSVLLQDCFSSRITKFDDFLLTNSLNYSQTTQRDALMAWHITCTIKTNSAVIVRNGRTLAIAAGHQDGITAIEHAIYKSRFHGKGSTQDIKGAVIAVDGNFPHELPVKQLTEAKAKAFILPGQAPNDKELLDSFKRTECSVIFTQERCFSH
jgi:AICAR transformylase/IMP cyclohydrolase PurH